MNNASYPGVSALVKKPLPEDELDERTILQLLNILQEKLLARRGCKTTLVVHGGVIEVLALKCRRYTSDIDYIERVLPEDLEIDGLSGWASALKNAFSSMFPQKDTRDVVRECIFETANLFNADTTQRFCVGYDWMNAGADTFLPWHLDERCNMFDPLVSSALTEKSHIVYDSPGLQLIGITPSWTFALKLQRFSEADEASLVYFLQEDGACAVHSEVEFVQMMETRLRLDCRELEFELWTEEHVREWRGKLVRCVKKARFLGRSRPNF